MANVGKIAGGVVKATRKAIEKKYAKKSTAKGLKAAQGKSLAPKGYKPDTSGRAAVNTQTKYSPMGVSRKTAFRTSAKDVENARAGKPSLLGSGSITPAPKNVISKSGRVANTAKLIKKASKKK